MLLSFSAALARRRQDENNSDGQAEAQHHIVRSHSDLLNTKTPAW
jgi:hypothetical protein